MNQLTTGTTYADFTSPTGSRLIHARIDRHHDGVAITVAHVDELDRTFATPAAADAYLAFLQAEVEQGTTLYDIVQAASVLTTAAAVLDEFADAEVIHLRREPNPIACGATGPVRVTRVFSEVTCQACVDAEDRRLGRRDDTAQPATLDTFRQAHRATPTRSRVHCKPLTTAEQDLVRNHHAGVVTVRPGQPWTMLKAIHQRIGGERTYKPGTRIIASLRLTDEQIGTVAA